MERVRDVRMSMVVALGLLILAVAGVASAQVAKDPFDAMTVHRPVEPFPAPDLAFRSLDGREVRLRDFRGKVVVLGFFTTS